MTDETQELEVELDLTWEVVDQAVNAVTQRMKVEGGWLYYVGIQSLEQMAVCFVPDVDLTRYQSHLRDAYKRGYEDGQQDAKKGFAHPQ